MFSYAFLPFILALECALDCCRRLQIFILRGRSGLECISDCFRRLQIFILCGRGGLECITDCFRRPEESVVFGLRKCQWSPEPEKLSNWTLFPYRTSFKNRPSKSMKIECLKRMVLGSRVLVISILDGYSRIEVESVTKYIRKKASYIFSDLHFGRL